MLDDANRLLQSSKKENILKSYNKFKTLYIRSILESDLNLKKEALKGLIKSSKKLGFDYKDYEKELYSIIPKTIKKESLNNRINKRNIKIDKAKKNILKNISLKKGEIDFVFLYSINTKDIKSFDLNYKNKKVYKKVFDIKGVWPYSKRVYKLRSVDRLKIAQFDKDIIRLVFENSKKVDIFYKIDKNVLKIAFDNKLNKNISTINKIQKVNKKSSVIKKSVYKKFYPITKTIVIDPGHGGKDSGAIGYKRKKEKDAVLQIAKKLYKELKKRGYKVYLTRTKDYFIPLRNRTKYANRRFADIFISIHANAAPKKSRYLSMKGVETFFLSPARSQRAKKVAALENRADLSSMSYYSKQTFLNFLNREKIVASNKLAIDVQKGILYNLKKRYKNVVDGGVREGPFWVLVGAQMPSILVEVGYITNPTEAKRIFNPLYQKLLAKGIADGIDNYFIHNQ
ncbi:N-acetylmuramoyl-L-alanine amidase family protein [Nitrosophilus kaiyonis]|uniref:N-acetylmuramoyl-L-alanine amidase family protein n=1 Tax=Nitrosophilus kaiyonis TaxID=2930200 RepID=UPI0024927D58|nr:N-acetylmuramoyl-L-alanine amidase [Nitrosophilus kaiyonis]